MDSDSIYLWVMVQGLIPMIAFWVGVIVLRQTRSGVIWWFLLLGALMTTTGTIAIGVITPMTLGPHPALPIVAVQIVSIFNLCAWCLFGVSFALHAFSMARLAKRAQELEGVCSAMSAEIQQPRFEQRDVR